MQINLHFHSLIRTFGFAEGTIARNSKEKTGFFFAVPSLIRTFAAMKRFFLFLMLLPMAVLGQDGTDTIESQTVLVEQGPDGLTLRPVDYSGTLTARLDTLMADSLLETTQLGLMVWDLTTDSLLYQHNARQLLRPASTMKLLTAITALDHLGVYHRYNTSLYYKGTISRGQLTGDLICVGGMDPMFDNGDMKAMAKAVRQLGITSLRGKIICDNSMKDQDKWGEGWCWDDKNPTLSPLLIEGSPMFSNALVRELKAAGVTTAGATVTSGKLPAGATLVCTRWHSIDDVMLQMMKESDNLYAEATYYQVAASCGHRPATARDAQKYEEALLTRAGLDAEVYRLADGSGLSLYNYLSAEAEVMILRYAWQKPTVYNHLLATLPVAGVDGTLKKRMTDDEASCGNVVAKTGTVTGVSALAGYLTAPNGHRLAFSIINQGIRHAGDGRRFQDRLCHILCTL